MLPKFESINRIHKADARSSPTSRPSQLQIVAINLVVMSKLQFFTTLIGSPGCFFNMPVTWRNLYYPNRSKNGRIHSVEIRYLAVDLIGNFNINRKEWTFCRHSIHLSWSSRIPFQRFKHSMTQAHLLREFNLQSNLYIRADYDYALINLVIKNCTSNAWNIYFIKQSIG